MKINIPDIFAKLNKCHFPCEISFDNIAKILII